jgi:hypothetical protein
MQTVANTPTGLEEIRLKDKEKMFSINELTGKRLSIAVHEIMGLTKYASIDMQGRLDLKLPVCLDPTGMWQGIEFNPAEGDAESIDWVVDKYRPLITSLATGGFSVQLDDVEVEHPCLAVAVCRAVVKRFHISSDIYYFNYNIKL